MGQGSSNLSAEEIEQMKEASQLARWRRNQLVVSEEDLKNLYRKFRSIDKDKSDEFLSIPELAANPLLERIVSIFDSDQNAEIEFTEFISALSTFHAGTEKEKLHFIFRVYDINNDGFITNGELFKVLKMMVGTNLTEIQLQQIVDKSILYADKDKDGKISFEEFCAMIGEDAAIGDKLTINLNE